MKGLMNIVMLSCKRSSGLIEKKSTGKLSFQEGIQLKVHTFFCKTCTTYQKQSKAIDLTIFNWVKNKDNNAEVKLSDKIKGNILKEIKKNCQE